MPSQQPEAVIPPAPTLMVDSREVALDQRSVTVVLPVDQLRERLGDAAAASSPPDVRIVLDDVELRGAGRSGGYFYRLYVNLPLRGSGSGRARDYLVGTLGPFEIAAVAKGASQRGTKAVRFSLPVGQALRAQGYAGADELRLSFVRVSAPASPQGNVIFIGAVRVETG